MKTIPLKQLKNIRGHGSSWKKGLLSFEKTKLDNDPILLLDVMHSFGLNIALDCLAQTQNKKYIVLFACHCACRVLEKYEKKYPRKNKIRYVIELISNYENEERDDLNSSMDKNITNIPLDCNYSGISFAMQEVVEAAYNATSDNRDREEIGIAGMEASNAAEEAVYGFDMLEMEERMEQQIMFIKICEGEGEK